MPLWDDLHLLSVLGRTGSLSKAAAELGLTQPTVGRRLDRLEQDVGTLLVRRTSTGCALTEAGTALLPELDRMQAAADAITRLTTHHRDELGGLVRLATGELPARFLLDRLGPVLAQAPGLQLELQAGISTVRLDRGDADLAIRSVRPTGDAWVVQELGRVPFARYTRAGRPPSERWVARNDSTPSTRWLQRTLGRGPDVALSSSLLVVEACAAGLGVAVLPVYIGESDPRLERVGEPLPDLAFDSLLVIHPSARRLPRVRWLAAQLTPLLRDVHRGADVPRA